MRNEETTEAEKNLSDLRGEIDEIDLKVSALLARRHEIVVEIGRRKHALGVKVHDDKREKFVLDRVAAQGRDESAASFIRDVYDRILHVSRETQKNLPGDQP